ncbi:Aromatic/aminoadipate aminotransferase 1 [Entomophthora muscae]|uniref:Aromatic/aminoadipate aminotransferase 1 n=1 Tax=Entomophthora muscae TaxID=34485 RepID=A0ACC2UU35_9FUNG|nr:Aromatic/aminoadipate aminotransferase 1 [Entomophthora muscae]
MTPTEQISSQNKARNFDLYFTSEASLRKPNPLITLAKYTHNPENIFLASGKNQYLFNRLYTDLFLNVSLGLPRIDAFPIEELSFKARDPISGELKEFIISKETDSSCPIGLNQAQQYGNGLGLSPLREFVCIHTKQLHKPCYQDWDVIPTTGNTDSLYKISFHYSFRLAILFLLLVGAIQQLLKLFLTLVFSCFQLILMTKV